MQFVLCLVPGAAVTNFVVNNPSDTSITVRAGSPTLPWLIVSEGDRLGFTVPPGSSQTMIAVVDSAVYDSENDIAYWPVVIEYDGQPHSTQVFRLASILTCPVPEKYTSTRSAQRLLCRPDQCVFILVRQPPFAWRPRRTPVRTCATRLLIRR